MPMARMGCGVGGWEEPVSSYFVGVYTGSAFLEGNLAESTEI